jgi:hypothetical protein
VASKRKATSSSPASWDPESAMPTRSAKEALPSFVGSQRRRWSPNEGMDKRAGKKLSGAQGWRTQAEGVTSTEFQKLLLVCTSLEVSKVVS